MGNESLVASLTELSQVINITLKKPSLTYLDEFIGLTCAPDLLALKLFPNAKEITESMAMFQAVVRTARGVDTKDKKTKLFVIGDGSTPRTAAMFAFRTSWSCWSIDPALSMTTNHFTIKRLSLIKDKVESINGDYLSTLQETIADGGRNILVLPHAHVPHSSLEKLFPDVTNWSAKTNMVVTMPCCHPFKEQQETWHGRKPDIVYHDWRVHSPEREIRIWR